MSSGDLLNNFLKALLPIGLIISFKLFLSMISLSHRKFSITAPQPLKLYVELALKITWWAIMIAAVALSVHMLITSGHITFIPAATKFASVTPDEITEGIDFSSATGNQMSGVIPYVENMYLLFLATSLSAALAWQEHSNLKVRQRYASYMGSVVQKCEDYALLEKVTAVSESVLKYISDERFLRETVSSAHSDLHDSVLTSLQRAKSFVERCTDVDSAPDGPSKKIDKVHVDEGVYLKDKPQHLKQISKAMKKLERLNFYLPTSSMPQDAIESKNPKKGAK